MTSIERPRPDRMSPAPRMPECFPDGMLKDAGSVTKRGFAAASVVELSNRRATNQVSFDLGPQLVRGRPGRWCSSLMYLPICLH